MNNLQVRQALNYAVNREDLVKIFGGQGTPTENIVPIALGSAYKSHNFYPYDLAKAKRLVAASGTKGMAVQVWSSSTDPQPQAAQYMASVLDSLGYKATVKTMSEGIYYDTVANEATDPQVSYNEWDQDFPRVRTTSTRSSTGATSSRSATTTIPTSTSPRSTARWTLHGRCRSGPRATQRGHGSTPR